MPNLKKYIFIVFSIVFLLTGAGIRYAHISMYCEDNGCALKRDENNYYRHAEAIRDYFRKDNTYDFFALYGQKQYQNVVRFFPPFSPFVYSLPLFIFDKDDHVNVRLVPFIFSLGILVVGFFLLSSFSKYAVMIGLPLLSLSPTLIGYSAWLWTESIFIFLILSSLLMINRIRLNGIRKRYACYLIILLSALCLTRGNGIFVSVMLIFFAIFLRWSDDIFSKFRFLSVIVGISVIVFLWQSVLQSNDQDFMVTNEGSSVLVLGNNNEELTYDGAWEKINDRARELDISKSNAAKSIALDYMTGIGYIAVIERGWDNILEALAPDALIMQHLSNAHFPHQYYSNIEVLINWHIFFHWVAVFLMLCSFMLPNGKSFDWLNSFSFVFCVFSFGVVAITLPDTRYLTPTIYICSVLGVISLINYFKFHLKRNEIKLNGFFFIPIFFALLLSTFAVQSYLPEDEEASLRYIYALQESSAITTSVDRFRFNRLKRNERDVFTIKLPKNCFFHPNDLKKSIGDSNSLRIFKGGFPTSGGRSLLISCRLEDLNLHDLAMELSNSSTKDMVKKYTFQSVLNSNEVDFPDLNLRIVPLGR